MTPKPAEQRITMRQCRAIFAGERRAYISALTFATTVITGLLTLRH